MKKLLVFLTVALLLIAFPASGLAAHTVTVTLDGEALRFDVPPVLENERVLVPMRAIFEALGSKVDWDGASRTVTATAGADPSTGLSRLLKLTVGQKTAYLDGRPVELDVPARMVKGRTLVPVRFAAEALGAQVDWQAAARRVVIKDKQRYYDQAVAFLARGDLADARKTVISAPVKFPEKEIPYLGEASFSYTYFFPEGEAGRYYYWQGGNVRYVEALNGVFTVTWQALIKPLSTSQGATLPADDTLSRYFNKNGRQVTVEERGERPVIDKPLIFFQYQPPTANLRYGRINPHGSQEVLGDMTYSQKNKLPAIPGEKSSPATPPAATAAMLASQIPEKELSEAEAAELERRWTEKNFYPYGEIAGLNRDFLDVALRSAYLASRHGLPRSSEAEENLRIQEEYRHYLDSFSEEVQKSSGWADFLALEPRRDPVFNVLDAASSENHIQATMVANFFSGFGFVPALLEVELEKEGDTWRFTGMKNVRGYNTIQELQAAESAVYDLLVQTYNLRRPQGLWLQ